MSYSKDISIDGKLDANLVLLKMNSLRDQHINNGTDKALAVSFAFDFGRELIGFDLAAAWKLGNRPTISDFVVDKQRIDGITHLNKQAG